MPINSSRIPVFEFIKNSPAVIVGQIGITGQTVTVTVYENGSVVTLTSNATQEIGVTGNYAFLTSNITDLLGSPRRQFQIVFDDGAGKIDVSEFIIQKEGELNSMPPISNTPNFLNNMLGP